MEPKYWLNFRGLRHKLKKRRKSAYGAIKIYEAELKDPKNKKYKKIIEDEIDFERRIIATISERIPE